MPEDAVVGHHLGFAARALVRHCAQAGFTLACLPYEAYFSLDAIVRTNVRMLVTHSRLLEWSPASGVEAGSRTSLAGFWQSMWIGPVTAIGLGIYLIVSRPIALAVAAPILTFWFASPAIAWWVSRSPSRREAKLSADQMTFLRKVSRKTWAFFETFVDAEDHWLPPDNYQEHPVATVAHRTSPTNMGISLLSNLGAYDFGYISAGKLIERTANALETMSTLERSQGHFYNWYDTRSLRPLTPIYISTVDSGNLAGHLLTLRPGLLALPDDKIVRTQLWSGLDDTLRVLKDAAGNDALAQLAQFQLEVESGQHSEPATLTAIRMRLDRLVTLATEVAAGFDNAPESGAAWWAHALLRQCRDALDEITFLAPWILLPASKDLDTLDRIPTLAELANLDFEKTPEGELRDAVAEGRRRATERLSSLENLALQCELFSKVEYDFLFDRVRQQLSIGYSVGERRRDSSAYDLLASEARLCSFVAIAQGQLPQENWFALGRMLTSTGGPPTLISWSGSMFEYLMPLLVMPTYEDTLLNETYKGAVERQIDYGRRRGVPWGISESGYNTIDAQFNYQYRAFGVPGLGLKRGLAEDLVIAPYASALALMVEPEEACLNLEQLAAEGAEGKYGFYEAIDYTPSRLPRGQKSALVRSFMAHHQGMSFLSLAYSLLDRPMQKRFEADASFRATTLLLQERVLKATRFHLHTAKFADSHKQLNDQTAPVRVLNSPDSPVPEVQLLSNGRYHVMVTNGGGGYSRWKDIAVTRWREDTTCDNWGAFCYIRDVTSGEFWSTAYQPALKRPDWYEVIFSEGRAEFRRRDSGIDTHTEIAVSPEDDLELHRLKITNLSRTRKVLEVTSYAEVVLTSPPADALHPAFSNLFVQTEIIDSRHAILCTRRPESSNQQMPWMFHLMAVHGTDIGGVSYETDRMSFLGRGNSVADPQAMKRPGQLSGNAGSVLDPIVAIRYRIALEPGKSATINIVTGVTETRDTCLGLIEKYQDWRIAERVFDLAWTHGQVVLQQINATETDAQLYGRLASSVLYANPTLRADPVVLVENRRGQSGLWSYSISGDLPIVLLRIEDPANIDLVRQLVQAHAYWRVKGLAVDLVIWNEDHAGYRQLLQDQIMGLITAGIEAILTDRPGGIFVRPMEHISSEDRILLQSVARAIITDSRGSLESQLDRRGHLETPVPRLAPARMYRAEVTPPAEAPGRDLIFFNGLGGFTADGREYVITTARGQPTPSPWVNVLANRHFGTVISESGLAYTWIENAHEFRLTPWNNDPVSDASGEACFIRDEENGHFWSPAPLPTRPAAPCVSRHGFGYSVFETTENGISSEMSVYVATDAPVKFTVLKVRNNSGRARRLSATGYVEWVLGDLRPKCAMHVITEVDPSSGALFARNQYNTEFGGRVAFFDVDDTSRTVSGDRTEFLGRNGTLKNPAAMARTRLSGKVGAALDPCGAIQVPFDLADGQEREIVFKLGVGRDSDDATNLVRRFRGSGAARGALEVVWQYWKHTLGTVNVETEDRSLNVLANGWLLYQTLASRFYARSGYYQSGGAWGFRDQLQDVMALIHAEPLLVREHLLLCASRQFREGDVQHWWHPPSGRGVRTHCSDDFLWLPLATWRYVVSTGDTGVLDESVHFLEGRPLNPEEESYYDLPHRSDESASLYEHCVRAIQRGLQFGAHGLPLMGSGDWNDGMNKVGEKGKGESVWLAFFLYDVLMQFTDIARLHSDAAFAERCQTQAAHIRENIEQHGWDGEWYLRAYFDDGTPLGSASNPECQIDSIAQSWSVLSGAGDAARARMAMESVNKRLVRREHALIQLLDPPFDKSNLDPGYIKGYVPGVRENGGQYTHAAVWATMAFAALGDSRRAWELFEMIDPVNHAQSSEAIATYKVEPYVVAADVYARSPHTGRGGWTWYTGSAGWTYRLILESLLGLRLEVDKLSFAPCLPADWTQYRVHYRYRETVYHIVVLQTKCETRVTVDGIRQPENSIPLVDDRQNHSVEVKVPVRSE
jgi:cellobiose phosphorylase